jgi:hypothetical protein
VVGTGRGRGGGDGPWAIIMARVRTSDEQLRYPVSALSARNDPSEPEETPDPEGAGVRAVRKNKA